jgi:hypothetical protein
MLDVRGYSFLAKGLSVTDCDTGNHIVESSFQGIGKRAEFEFRCRETAAVFRFQGEASITISLQKAIAALEAKYPGASGCDSFSASPFPQGQLVVTGDNGSLKGAMLVQHLTWQNRPSGRRLRSLEFDLLLARK